MSVSRLVSTSPDKADSLENFIAAGENAAIINYYNFSILQVETTEDKTLEIHFTVDNLINDYLDVFRESATKVNLNQDEQRKYYYNPDLLAYDIYGSVELDFVIMIMNGIIDAKDFNMPSLLLLKKSTMTTIMSKIYNAERRYISDNRLENNLVVPGT